MSTPPDFAARSRIAPDSAARIGCLASLQLSRTFYRHLGTLQTHGLSLMQKQFHVKVLAGESSAKGEKHVACVHRFEVGT
jgi:hypothetical protein